MNEINVKCPDCGAEFPLSKALAKELEGNFKAKFQEKLRADIEAEFKASSGEETRKLRADLETKTAALDKARTEELALRKQKRDLEEREKDLQLQVERTLDRERASIAEKAVRDAEENHRYKDLEKDKKLQDTLSQVEELKRRIEQGSQKVQGEVFEVELEASIRTAFPSDTVAPVASGIKGGDILQIVHTRTGRECGSILWELKRTRSFSEPWITKLKSDARNCKADVCLLVTETMPEGVRDFTQMDGVWVCSIASCFALNAVLRQTLILVSQERMAQDGRKSKAELVYDYLIGVEFKGRIESVLEAFKNLNEDLESEKRAMEKIWAKREKAIRQVVSNLAGMHGDLAGYAGSSLPEIKILQLEKGK